MRSAGCRRAGRGSWSAGPSLVWVPAGSRPLAPGRTEHRCVGVRSEAVSFSGLAAGSHAPSSWEAGAMHRPRRDRFVLRSLAGSRVPRCDRTSTDATDAWVRTVRTIGPNHRVPHHSWPRLRPRLTTDQAPTSWRSLISFPLLDTGSAVCAGPPADRDDDPWRFGRWRQTGADVVVRSSCTICGSLPVAKGTSGS
jgi:hypothetical protein